MPSAHWSIDPDLLTWVRAESKRRGWSTSQVVSAILRQSQLGEQTISAHAVASWLESAQYDDTSGAEQRALEEAARVLRERCRR